MAAYNFKERFVEPIRNGTKRHTIRAKRADGRVPKVHEPLYLYTGMRTKNCQRIIDPVECTKVQQIEIGRCIVGLLPFVPYVKIDGTALSPDEREQLAVTDGFADFKDMMAFWDGRLPFEGQIIYWR